MRHAPTGLARPYRGRDPPIAVATRRVTHRSVAFREIEP